MGEEVRQRTLTGNLFERVHHFRERFPLKTEEIADDDRWRGIHDNFKTFYSHNNMYQRFYLIINKTITSDCLKMYQIFCNQWNCNTGQKVYTLDRKPWSPALQTTQETVAENGARTLPWSGASTPPRRSSTSFTSWRRYQRATWRTVSDRELCVRVDRCGTLSQRTAPVRVVGVLLNAGTRLGLVMNKLGIEKGYCA